MRNGSSGAATAMLLEDDIPKVVNKHGGDQDVDCESMVNIKNDTEKLQ